MALSSIYPSDITDSCDKICYFKQYVNNKFCYLNPDNVIYPPGDESDLVYLCQWVVDEDGTVIYIIGDKQAIVTENNCENTEVSLFVWNDNELENFEDFNFTKKLEDIQVPVEESLAFFTFLQDNYNTVNYHSDSKNKNTLVRTVKQQTILSLHADTCSICLCSYAENSEVTQLLNCKHQFCHSCINTWLEKSCLCPLCRSDCF